MHVLIKYSDNLGKRVFDVVKYTLEAFLMIYLSFKATLYDQAQGMRTIFSVISAQVYFTGWQALPIVSVLALASGAAIILQGTSQFSFFGGTNMLGNLIVAVVVRELSPLLTALIVIARSGTAVASELGSMKVNREVEGLESMGINPLSYIVFPRFMGGVISVLCLAFYFNVVAIIGGFFVTIFIRDIDFLFYTNLIIQSLAVEDIYMYLLKNTFSGAMIFVIACKQGMSVQKSSHEVPQMTTLAVVRSLIYVVCFNLITTGLFYLNHFIKLGVL